MCLSRASYHFPSRNDIENKNTRWIDTVDWPESYTLTQISSCMQFARIETLFVPINLAAVILNDANRQTYASNSRACFPVEHVECEWEMRWKRIYALTDMSNEIHPFGFDDDDVSMALCNQIEWKCECERCFTWFDCRHKSAVNCNKIK